MTKTVKNVFSFHIDENISMSSECMTALLSGLKEMSLFDLEISKIGSGREGVVYSVSLSEQVLKVILNGRNDEEIDIAKSLGKLGIGPEVYATWICPILITPSETFFDNLSGEMTAGFMIMKKYDTTLHDWIRENRKSWFSEKDALLHKISVLIDALHSEGIIHDDLHTENVLLKLDDSKISQIVLADFGRSKRGEDGSDRDRRTLAFEINQLLNLLDLPDRISNKDIR